MLGNIDPDQRPAYAAIGFLCYIMAGAAVAALYGTRHQKYKRVFVIYAWPLFAVFIMVPVGLFYFFRFTFGLLSALISGASLGFLEAIIERAKNND